VNKKLNVESNEPSERGLLSATRMDSTGKLANRDVRAEVAVPEQNQNIENNSNMRRK